MHVKRFATFCNVLKTNANFYVASRDAGSSRHCYQTSQAKKRPFLAPKSRRGPHQAKKSPRSRTSQSRPDKQVEEKEKPQVRGCRTLVLCGTGRQDSPGRGDGLGWTFSTPPDSNGVPRDVPTFLERKRSNVKIPPSHFTALVCSCQRMDASLKL